MPKAYTVKDLNKAKEHMALTRPHICSNCGTNQRLSHSHLVPKSYNSRLAAVADNIVYHCMGMGETKGCHSQYESMDVVLMKDFESNFEIIYTLDRSYFWLRLGKLESFWNKEHTTPIRYAAFYIIRNLYKKYTRLEEVERAKAEVKRDNDDKLNQLYQMGML